MPRARGGAEAGSSGRRGGRGGARRGARPGLGTARAAVGESFAIESIEDFPCAPPAAQPLHPRRKRRLPSPSPPPPSPPQPSTSSEETVVKMETVDSVPNIKIEFIDMLSAAPEALVDLSAVDPMAPSTASSPRKSLPRRPPPQRLEDSDIDDVFNEGSEEESGLSSSDDEDFDVVVSRVDRDVERAGVGWTEVECPESPEREAVDECGELVGQLGPVDMYSFDWVHMGADYVADLGRKETFAPPRPVGSIRPFADAYDAFTAIWNPDIMELICTQTNEYAQAYAADLMRKGLLHPTSRITKWVPTTVDELYLVFAIDIAMGILQKGSLEEYWSMSKDMFETPGFRAVMSRNRYALLKRCLHFCSAIKAEENLTPPQVKLRKIQPIVDHLNERFRSLYVPDVDIALDESLTQWKGWLSINQIIRNKAANIGIKSYEVCESKTGYLHRLEVHAGHENLSDDTSPATGIIPSLVLRLLSDLENRGHTVWMDNYYNSPALARCLKSRGFDCVGTLRTDRQFVPKELKDLKKSDIPKGGIVGATSGDVDIMVWHDKNRVGLISTYHGNVVSRCDSGNLKPNVVLDYNLRMGGVDKKDQMLAAYPMERKRTKIWYKKFFRRLVNVSILNAYILCKSSPDFRLTHRQFRKQLCQQLLARHQVNPDLQPPDLQSPAPIQSPDLQGPAPIHPPRQNPQLDVGANAKGVVVPITWRNHFPEPLVEKDKTNRTKKRHCVHCKKKTVTFCPGCNVALCSLTCFRPFHS